MSDGGKLGNGLDNTGLVVGEHYGDELGIRAQCGREGGGLDDALGVAGQEGDFDRTGGRTVLCERLGGVENSVVLDAAT